MVLSPVYIYDLACIFNLCVYVCVFMYSRTIAHVELMFLLIKPTLNKVYFPLLYFTLTACKMYKIWFVSFANFIGTTQPNYTVAYFYTG